MHLEEVVRDDRPPRGLSSLAHRVSQPASVRSELENDLVAALCKRRGRSSARVNRRYSSIKYRSGRYSKLELVAKREAYGPKGQRGAQRASRAEVRTDHTRHTSKPPTKQQQCASIQAQALTAPMASRLSTTR